MENRILFVDDDSNILDGYKRQLRKQFSVETAEGGEKGLVAVKDNGPFAVIVSDLKMPGMDGNRFLAHVKDITPESTRILLTGYADLRSAIEAINNGSIFRLLTKPCDKIDLIQALENGIDQYLKNVRSKAGNDALDNAAKKKILIVDDDPATVRLLQKSLEDIEDMEVFSAGDGRKAIKLLNSENFDLLVCDIFMPQVNVCSY
jgi:DNA-binding NtrC family response regulator